VTRNLPSPSPLRAPISDPPTPSELAFLSEQLETWPAEKIVEWAVSTFGSTLCVTSAMADTVMVHLATEADPAIEVVFLETGFHFPETLATLDRATQRYGLNVSVMHPAADAPNKLQVGVDGCCAARKVEGLNRALSGKRAWMTGLRRSESITRANTPIVSLDDRSLVKICPIAKWEDADVESYIATHDLIVNPLLAQGYLSIGCWPCTSKVEAGADPRSGRWSDSDKTECGIHSGAAPR
jgi:phosphoadenosine phosphosulfate reductase